MKIKFIVLFVSLSLLSAAQVEYPKDSTFISVLSNEQKNNHNQFSYTPIDTNINRFQNYFSRRTNGHIGLPSSAIFLNTDAKALGFNLYKSPYNTDFIAQKDINYFQTKGPYASLTGIAGSKQEQLFKLLFSNTFKNKVNLTLAFNRYGGLGFYKRQQTFTNNLYITSNYTNPKKRMGYYTYFLFNKAKHLENGGIKSDSLFLVKSHLQKQLFAINITNAKREVRLTTYHFNPWLKLNASSDSTTRFSHIIDYHFNYSGNYIKYNDLAPKTDQFYSSFYLDTISTKDSTHWKTIENRMNYILKINPLLTQIQIGVKNEYDIVHQFRDSIFMNNSVHAGLYINQKNYQGYLTYNYIFNGTNIDDYSIEFNNRYQTKLLNNLLKSPIFISIKANIEKRHPDYIYNTWLSNNFSWSNHFKPSETSQGMLMVGTKNNRFDVGCIYQTTKNQLYFDSLALPKQANFNIQNISLFIHKDLLIFKHLGINLQYNYQASSKQSITSLPNHIINSALYYQGNLFKNNLQLQVGFNVEYYNLYYAMAYMPATNSYYLQDKRMTGNYPFVDFFINARIKPVRVFFKVDHANQGLSGANYSLMPNYIQNDRALKFGINWLFFD